MITYHVVVPFDRNEEGNLVAGEAKEAPNGDIARRRAQALAATHAGAIALSRTGDPDSGEFAEAVVTAAFGEVDKGACSGEAVMSHLRPSDPALPFGFWRRGFEMIAVDLTVPATLKWISRERACARPFLVEGRRQGRMQELRKGEFLTASIETADAVYQGDEIVELFSAVALQ